MKLSSKYCLAEKKTYRTYMPHQPVHSPLHTKDFPSHGLYKSKVFNSSLDVPSQNQVLPNAYIFWWKLIKSWFDL